MFKIDIEICETCGGKMKVIASIEDLAVIKRSWRISTTDKARGNIQMTHHMSYCWRRSSIEPVWSGFWPDENSDLVVGAGLKSGSLWLD